MSHQVTGIFDDPKKAEEAVRNLIDTHFAPADISIVVTDRAGKHEEAVEHDTGVAEGAVTGTALGAVLGALGATLVATGVIVSPALGVFATGPLLAAMKGAAAGAAVGLEVGALAGLGFWKDEAQIHAEALGEGGIVVAVPAVHEHAEHARKAFAEAGARHVRG